jgi:hypothetical protein
MISYIKRKHIDDERWNACIRASFNGNLYAHTWFLDIVAENWDALVENDYERVFPLPFKKKLGFTYIYQPFFTQQLGLFSRSRLSSGILEKYIGAIPKHFSMAEINLNTLNKADHNKHQVVPQINHELDLINQYENLRSAYSENLVRNLKKAEKAGLTISKNVRPEDIVGIFRNSRGNDFPHLRDADYLRLKRIGYTAIYKNIADIRGVYDRQNQLCAGAFFLLSHRKAVFLFSGLTAEGRESGAMPFLIDSFIRENSGEHLTFDFDGSNDNNLARFYKSFGSKELIYQRLEINRLPGWMMPAVRTIKWLKKR